ncbi:MAG: GNAT family N-acetyltransferase, partial [Mycobacteriales bacterium]
PAQWIPNGKMGYLQGFYTKPAWRGRGAAGGIARSLIAWLELIGCSWAQLHPIAEAAPIYRKLGFTLGRHDNLWLRLPAEGGTQGSCG